MLLNPHRLLFFLLSLSLLLLGMKEPIDRLRSRVNKIRSALEFYEKHGVSQLNENPLADEDFASFFAKYHLRFYQGIGYFLAAEKQSYMTEQIRLLEKSRHSFIHSVILANHKFKPAKLWHKKINVLLFHKNYAAEQFFAAIQYYDRLTTKEKKQYEHKSKYAESLLATHQFTLLAQLFAHDHSFYQKKFKEPDFAQKIIAVSQRLKFNTSRQNPGKKNSVSHRSLAKKKKLRTRLEDTLKTLEYERYNHDNERRFQWIEKNYRRVLAKKNRQQQLSSNEAFLLKTIEQRAKNLPIPLLNKIILIHWEESSFQQAIELSEYALKKFHEHPLIPEITYNLGRLYENRKLYKKAHLYFKKNCHHTAGTLFDEKCQFRLAWSAFLARIPAYKKFFQLYLKQFPEGEFASVSEYYIKLDSVNRQQATAIIQEQPISYYSLLLLKKFNLPAKLIRETMPLVRVKRSDREKQQHQYKLGPHIQGKMRIYKELKRLELKEDAITILNNLQFHNENRAFMDFLLHEFQSWEDHRGQTILGLKNFNHFTNNRDQIGWSTIFPLFQQELIDRTLNDLKVSVPPYLINSIIRQESAFDTEAISRAKAKGLMQLIPPTAQYVADKIDLDEFDLFEAKDNIRLGIAYIDQLIQEYNGTLAYALSAYNAGPAHTDRWIETHGHLPEAYFIDSIPFQETRNYVKNVLRNWTLYQIIYSKEKV